jgi:WD40 repeat protein
VSRAHLLLAALTVALGACHVGSVHGVGGHCPCRSGYVCVNDRCEHPDSGPSDAPADVNDDGASAPDVGPEPDAAPPPSLAACHKLAVDEALAPEQRAPLVRAALAPGAPVLALLTTEDVRIWRTDGASPAPSLVLGPINVDQPPSGLALSPDGSLVATRGSVTVWRVTTGATELDFTHTDSAREASWPLVALAADNDRVAVAQAGARTLTVWSASSHALVAKVNVPPVLVAAASQVTAVGRPWWIAVGRAAGESLEISFVDLDSPQPSPLYPLTVDVHDAPPELALSADGTILAIIGSGLELWDVSNKARPRHLPSLPPLQSGLNGAAISPSGKYVALTTDGPPGIGIWPIDGGAVRMAPGLDSGARAPLFSGDGAAVVALASQADDPFAFFYCRD